MATLKSNAHFDQWTFNIDGKPVSIEVRVCKKHDGKIFFRASGGIHGDGEKKIQTDHTDIEKLRDAVKKRLEDNYRIDWSKKLHVRINSEFSMMDEEELVSDKHSLMEWKAKLEFQINAIETALRANGDKIHRTSPFNAPTPNWPDVGGLELKKGESKGWHDIDMQVLIDDTPENRAALNTIMEGYKRLNERLCELLNPENAQKTLTNWKIQSLLPGPGRD